MEFESIYKDYWQKVYRLAMGYVNDPSWAKDITQECFVIVWQKLSSFRNESAIGTWIFRIASNLCLRQIEKDKKRAHDQLDCDIASKDIQKNTNDDEKMKLMYTCISELPEIDRIIISLELEDVKQAEIAQIVGISEVNTRVRIHRIKGRLTKKLLNYESTK